MPNEGNILHHLYRQTKKLKQTNLLATMAQTEEKKKMQGYMMIAKQVREGQMGCAQRVCPPSDAKRKEKNA